MKKTFLLLIVSSLLLFQSCEDYLDKTPESDGLTEEEVFSDYLNFRQFEDGMYEYMHDYLLNWDQSFIAAMSDEGYTQSEWETLPVVQNGSWLSAYETGGAEQFYGVWESWEAIRIANISIQNIPVLEESGHSSKREIEELKGQAHFMRAWYYYEFLRRQGGMPYITKPLDPTDDFGLPRLSAYETAKMIAADCDTAAILLPDRWPPAHLGRPTEGAAMALKATALLFGASPNNNPSNEVSRWEEAANASWDFIGYAESTGRYRLLPSNGTETIEYMTPSGPQQITYPSGRDSVFMYQPTNDEIIWEHYASVNNSKYTSFGVASLTSRSRVTGYSPSQNIVDMFETTNGLSIEDDQDYDPDNPYVDRDPRFYQSILFNQRLHADTYLELFNGGSERTGEKFSGYTGYLSSKYWPSYVHSNSGAQPPMTHTIYLRYADLLLQYAEAANEIGGPNHTISGATMSAVDAVNMVRARVDMPPVDGQYLTDKNTFRERIKNERAVELYLEGKRLFDLMRWGDAHKSKHKEIYAADIIEDASKPTGYEIRRSSTPVITLTFEQKHYRWPIPTIDANMFEEFKQNPGW